MATELVLVLLLRGTLIEYAWALLFKSIDDLVMAGLLSCLWTQESCTIPFNVRKFQQMYSIQLRIT